MDIMLKGFLAGWVVAGGVWVACAVIYRAAVDAVMLDPHL